MRERVALLVQVFDSLCRRHDRALYARLGEGELAAASPDEVARCWAWLAARSGQPLAAGGTLAGTPAGSLATWAGASQREQEAAMAERAGELFWRGLRRTGCVCLGDLPVGTSGGLSHWSRPGFWFEGKCS